MINERVFNALCEQIPNLLKFYPKERVFELMADVDTIASEIAQDFMEVVWDEPMRRCDVCGRLMFEGYYINGDYACDDECRNIYYKKRRSCKTDEEAKRLWLYDYIGADAEECKRLNSLSLEELDEYASVSTADTEYYYTLWE